MVCLMEIISRDLRISIPASGAQASLKYRIPRNNGRPLINRLPRIIALPAPLAVFSFFHPLPVKLKCNVIQQN